MGIIRLNCAQCNNEVEIDPSKGIGFCVYCGNKLFESCTEDRSEPNVVSRPNETSALNEITRWMEMGTRAYQSGNKVEAYAYFTKVVELEPNNWRAIFYKGMSAGWQSTLANVRMQEAIDATNRSRLVVLEASELSMEEKEDSINEMIDELYDLVYGFNNLVDNHYMEFSSDLIDCSDLFFETRQRTKMCLELYKYILNMCPNTSNRPNGQQLKIMQSIAVCCFSICMCGVNFTDYTKTKIYYMGLSASDKQEYLDCYDEMVYEIRKVNKDFRRNDDFPIDRLDPPKFQFEYNAKKLQSKQLQNNKDKELDERWQAELKREEERKQQEYWDQHPEEYQVYLVEQKKKQELEEQERQRKSEKRNKILNEIEAQQEIVSQNKLKFFGEGAQLKKEAKEKLNKLNEELRNIN